MSEPENTQQNILTTHLVSNLDSCTPALKLKLRQHETEIKTTLNRAFEFLECKP